MASFAEQLRNYIDKYHCGNSSDLACFLEIDRERVSKWINGKRPSKEKIELLIRKMHGSKEEKCDMYNSWKSLVAKKVKQASMKSLQDTRLSAARKVASNYTINITFDIIHLPFGDQVSSEIIKYVIKDIKPGAVTIFVIAQIHLTKDQETIATWCSVYTVKTEKIPQQQEHKLKDGINFYFFKGNTRASKIEEMNLVRSINSKLRTSHAGAVYCALLEELKTFLLTNNAPDGSILIPLNLYEEVASFIASPSEGYRKGKSKKKHQELMHLCDHAEERECLLRGLTEAMLRSYYTLSVATAWCTFFEKRISKLES